MAVVTRMLRTPAPSGGDTAVISVPETSLNFFARTEPNMTLLVPLNPVPVIVTVVPPFVGPDPG
jgi:hypothetical protein